MEEGLFEPFWDDGVGDEGHGGGRGRLAALGELNRERVVQCVEGRVVGGLVGSEEEAVGGEHRCRRGRDMR